MDTKLKEISLHFVGNKAFEQNLITSSEPLHVDDPLAELITTTFIQRFDTIHDEYNFSHPSSLQYNEVYNFAKNIFEHPANLHKSSKEIAEHLFEQTNHPKIKEGELHVALFEKCILDGAFVDAIGIFKTEVKSEYLEIKSDLDSFDVFRREGVDLKKVEKGCIIYNSKDEEGFLVKIFDNQGRGNEANYWKEDFLGLKPIANEFKQTNEFLGIAKQFITKQIDEEFEIAKTDKIDLLNKSVDYFKTHVEFSKEEFEEEVFGNSELIDSFKGFDQNYCSKNDIESLDTFDISSQAVKKQEKSFKSVLKLDKNFHIYIHGDRQLIEKGVDTDGRKFYKVYYDKEK